MGSKIRSSREKKLQKIVHDYMHECDSDSVDLEKVAEWAIQTGRWKRQPPTLVKMCKRELARAIRNEYYDDPQGREVRVMHPVRGEQMVFWVNIQTARPEHMRISLQNRRYAILYDCRQHRIDFRSYNDNNLYGAKLPPADYNFNLDLEELDKPTDYPEEKLDEE